MVLRGHSDLDWASFVDDRKSTIGYTIYLGANLIAWCAKKQKVMARSSTESEYKSLAMATAEIVGLKHFLLSYMFMLIPLVQFFGVIALVRVLLHLILFFILVPSTLRLMYILLDKKLLLKIFMCIMFLLKNKLLVYLPILHIKLVLLYLETNSL